MHHLLLQNKKQKTKKTAATTYPHSPAYKKNPTPCLLLINRTPHHVMISTKKKRGCKVQGSARAQPGKEVLGEEKGGG